jgi:hypothetical protein
MLALNRNPWRGVCEGSPYFVHSDRKSRDVPRALSKCTGTALVEVVEARTRKSVARIQGEAALRILWLCKQYTCGELRPESFNCHGATRIVAGIQQRVAWKMSIIECGLRSELNDPLALDAAPFVLQFVQPVNGSMEVTHSGVVVGTHTCSPLVLEKDGRHALRIVPLRVAAESYYPNRDAKGHMTSSSLQEFIRANSAF